MLQGGEGCNTTSSASDNMLGHCLQYLIQDNQSNLTKWSD